ncbi:MAG TPA: hypothetical protein PK402_10035 [Tepidisphaeraceae bacterium]|nr:hypothetical protein [Tepidisphaeraceae bacterium]
MNDPKQPHRPMPRPATGGGMIDPLMAATHTQQPGAPKPTIQPRPMDKIRLDEDAIALVDEPTPGAPGSKAGDSFGGNRIKLLDAERVKVNEQFKRTTNKTGTGSVRVRSFHCKYSDEGLRYMDNAINSWLDEHPDVEVKFVTSTVMTFEGKIREPALVLNVWF